MKNRERYEKFELEFLNLLKRYDYKLPCEVEGIVLCDLTHEDNNKIIFTPEEYETHINKEWIPL